MSLVDEPPSGPEGQPESASAAHFADLDRLRDRGARASAAEFDVTAKVQSVIDLAVDTLQSMAVEYVAKLQQVVAGKSASWMAQYRSGPHRLSLVEDRFAATTKPRFSLFGRRAADEPTVIDVWPLHFGGHEFGDDAWWLDEHGAWFISAGPGRVAPVAVPSLLGLQRALDEDYDEYLGLVLAMMDSPTSQAVVFESGERLEKQNVDAADLEQRIQEIVDGVHASMGAELERLIRCE